MKKQNIIQYEEKIALPEKVEVMKINDTLVFQGPLGTTKFHLKKLETLKKKKVSLVLSLEKDGNNKVQSLILKTTSKPFLGLYKTLLENKCIGVSRGFLVYLKIVGIGYRAFFSKSPNLNLNNGVQDEKKDLLIFKLGYSHDISYEVPSGIRIFLQNPGSICLFGVDKNQLTQIAASIRSLRKPGVYKNKGIQLSTEKLQFKSGKKK
jgi:large subunit ribosomal protein L6